MSLGWLAFLIGIAGLIMNNQITFVALAVGIIALWAIVTAPPGYGRSIV